MEIIAFKLLKDRFKVLLLFSFLIIIYVFFMKNLFSLLSKFTNKFILCFDIILFVLFIYIICTDLLIIGSYIADTLNNSYSDIIISCNVNPVPVTESSNTNTTIVHTSEGWAQGIKNIFIFGTGAYRLHLVRGGTPFQRTFIVASTIAAEAASSAIKNAVNDPEYVEKHVKSWSRIFKGENNSTLELNVDNDNETLSKLKEIKSNLLPDSLDSESILNFLIDYFKEIIEPVTVNYPTEMLANQIYGLSIILFFLSIFLLILLIGFILNIIILIYSDKLLTFFTNKYIRWYIILNKKLIGIEICFLGGSLIYFMYILSYGIHFIATHPIIFN